MAGDHECGVQRFDAVEGQGRALERSRSFVRGANPRRFVLVDRVAADQCPAVGLPEADGTERVSRCVEDVELHVAGGDDVAVGEGVVDVVGQDGLIEPA